MASAQATMSKIPSDEDDEWEYEYDENETEDFYVTIDMTTHIHKNQRKIFRGRQKEESLSSQARNARKPRGGKLGRRKHVKKVPQTEVEDAGEDQVEDDEGDSENDQDEEARQDEQARGVPDPTVHGDAPSAALAAESSPSNPRPAVQYADIGNDAIQILDLHSLNPLISYQGRIYSCEWATSIGTDMIFEAPSQRFPEANIDHGQSREASLLAITRHRLVAKPAKLLPRKIERPRPRLPITRRLSLQQLPDPPAPVSGSALSTPSGKHAAALAKKRANMQQRNADQVDFLKRLSALRKAKGEDDFVPMYYSEFPIPRAHRDGLTSPSICGRIESAVAGQGEDAHSRTSTQLPVIERPGLLGNPVAELASNITGGVALAAGAQTGSHTEDQAITASSAVQESELQASIVPAMESTQHGTSAIAVDATKEAVRVGTEGHAST